LKSIGGILSLRKLVHQLADFNLKLTKSGKYKNYILYNIMNIHELLEKLIANANTTQSWGDGKCIEFTENLAFLIDGLHQDEKDELIEIIKIKQEYTR
jgi:transcriptional antiterminator